MFSSDPNTPQANAAAAPKDLFGRLRAITASSLTGFMTDMWLARHTEEKTWPLLVDVIGEIVDMYQPQDICVVGYSFGGKYCLKILQQALDSAHTPANMAWARLVLTGVVCHPSLVEAKDFVGVKKPLLMIAIDNDPLFPDKVLKPGLQSLTTDNVYYELRTFDNLPHGFAVKGDYKTSRHISQRQQEAHRLIVQWLKSLVL
ncbi:uncharacterized protein V1510DRAFT_422844 [Dipodascopsis tothii]|uniref:uncharacterized protein n=1 Tax=Dipodascopsis tothii TaxID=44089 RepID=UPI0034CFC51B